jgi:hypothetical protein
MRKLRSRLATARNAPATAPEAFELSDYLVSTSVSGDFLEFMPRGAWPFTSR